MMWYMLPENYELEFFTYLLQETVKFDEMLCRNMDYYKEIAHLLQQKGTVYNIEEKFNSQLATQQGIMEKLTENSTLASLQR